MDLYKERREAFWIVTEGGQHMLYTPKGEPVKFVYLTRVTDDCKGIADADISLLVNLADNLEDMKQRIERYNSEPYEKEHQEWLEAMRK